MGDRNLDNWVSDQLHALLGTQVSINVPFQCGKRNQRGRDVRSIAVWQKVFKFPGDAGFAEGAIVSYVISLGRKASNAAILAQQLEGQVGILGSLSKSFTQWQSVQHPAFLSPRCRTFQSMYSR